jgi:hypothetical protein
MMKKPKNLEFEPGHPKNVLLASVVHGISCLFRFVFGTIKTSFEINFYKNLETPILRYVPKWLIIMAINAIFDAKSDLLR